ncbi:PhoPQ-activated pathogenicity-related family protein [bacterium]|nr:PhoPQ-activated pathogenicity-related family protein [bacterium]
MRTSSRLMALGLLCWASVGWGQILPNPALSNYVHHDDGAFNYSIVNVIRNPIVTIGGSRQRVAADVYFMNMTSQEWDPTKTESTGFQESRKLWQHEVAVIVPNVIRSTTAQLQISGGGNSADNRFSYFGTMGPNGTTDFSNDSELGAFASFAVATGSVFTILNQAPNQSIQFTNDIVGSRSEDGIIAKTVRNFIDGGAQETDWPLLLPMTKAAVKAMDLTQDFMRTNPSAGFSFGGFSVGRESPPIQDFVVSGGSKRGWTTWLTAAVDDRVKAIVPIVFDALNLGNQLNNQKAIYSRVENDLTVADSSGAKYSGALNPYISSRSPSDPNATADINLTVDFATKEGQKALSIIDPYSYRDAYTMPKYIVNSAGDEFFAINSSTNYFSGLPGEKYLWYIPNTTHPIAVNPDGTSNDEAIAQFLESYVAFYGSLKSGEDLPEYQYSILNEGKTVRVEFLNGLLPDEVSIWYNDGFEGQPDFRRSGIQNVGADGIRSTWYQWDPSQSFYSLSYLGNGIFEATANDITHWQAFMMQFSYRVQSVPFIDPNNLQAGWNGARFRFSSGVSIVGPEALTYNPPTKPTATTVNIESASLLLARTTAVPEASSMCATGLALSAAAIVALRRQRARRFADSV